MAPLPLFEEPSTPQTKAKENERGVPSNIFVRNIIGIWLINRCVDKFPGIIAGTPDAPPTEKTRRKLLRFSFEKVQSAWNFVV